MRQVIHCFNEMGMASLALGGLRQLLRKHDLTFQRTKTWKQSNDPNRDAELARIEEV